MGQNDPFADRRRVIAAADWAIKENASAVTAVLQELITTLRKHEIAASRAIYQAVAEEATRVLNGRSLSELPDTLTAKISDLINEQLVHCQLNPWDGQDDWEGRNELPREN